MNPIKRIKTTIVASFDNLVNEIENHEALINCAIKEAKNSTMTARLQLRRIQQQNKMTKQKIETLSDSRNNWINRIKNSHKSNPKLAIDCANRVDKIEKEILFLKERLISNQSTEKKVCQDLQIIEQKIQGLKEKRNQLSVRQSSASAIQTLYSAENNWAGELDDILERWEDNIAKIEIESDCLYPPCPEDELEGQFEQEEREEYLRRKVEELTTDRSEQ